MPEQTSPRDWSLFLTDMQRFCSKIQRYSRGLSRQQFLEDELVFDAVLRNLELLGEAAKQIPIAIKESYPEVPWRRVAGLRDVLAHAYFGLEDETVWQIVTESVPSLADQLAQVALTEGVST